MKKVVGAMLLLAAVMLSQPNSISEAGRITCPIR